MDTPKRIEKIIRESAFNNRKKKAGLKFNLPLGLTGVRTTGSGSADRYISGSVDRYVAGSVDRWIGRSLDLKIGGSVDRWIR